MNDPPSGDEPKPDRDGPERDDRFVGSVFGHGEREAQDKRRDVRRR